MSYQSFIHELLKDIGPGRMLSTAYDTAWIARLVELGEPIGQQALEWLRAHQLPDGTWGAECPHYYHDRLINTLAAMVALGKYGHHKDQMAVQRAKLGLDISVRGLRADPAGETVGFEMIVPTLLEEIRTMGLVNRDTDKSLVDLVCPYRDAKMAVLAESGQRFDDIMLNNLGFGGTRKVQALAKGKINRYITLAFSAEMVGTDKQNLLDADNLQEANGSVGLCPSASAYFALDVRLGDPSSLAYLRQTAEAHQDGGGMPGFVPFDTFERAWVLWNLSLTGPLDEETLALCQPHLDFLERSWNRGNGVGFSSLYTPKDGDVTSLVFDVLARYGRKMDVETILKYEKADHFRCYDLESNPSVSANIHILGALFQAGFPVDHPAVQKAINFLRRKRYLDMFWFDKWHISPYYTTAHAVMVESQFQNGLDGFGTNAIQWMLSTQNANGSWGYYTPSAEESAYCLQTLILWKRDGHRVPQDTIKRGLDWLEYHKEPPYIPLWISKCLYSPTMLVRSEILSALVLGAQEEMQ